MGLEELLSQSADSNVPRVFERVDPTATDGRNEGQVVRETATTCKRQKEARQCEDKKSNICTWDKSRGPTIV